MQPLRVMILGYGPMGLALARAVVAHPELATVVGVFPWSFHKSERFCLREAEEDAFRRYVQQAGLTRIKASGTGHFSFEAALQRLRPDIVLIGSWGEILKPRLLDREAPVFINCHPSLLPEHRGSNPYTATILAGEAETGITFHRVDHGIDTGPILLQRRVAIGADETGDSLRRKCAALAEAALPELLTAYRDGTLTPQPQDAGLGSYDRIKPEMGWLDWNNMPPNHLYRQIRALYPWLYTCSMLGKRAFSFKTGHPAPAPEACRHAGQPGRILGRLKGGIRVATTDPAIEMHLYEAQQIYVPTWLGKPGARFHLRPGCRFDSVPAGQFATP